MGAICENIHEHIASFPVQEVRYVNRNIKFLKAELTIKIMHSLFCQNNQDIDVSYGFYLKYFKEKFGYAFGRPQKDICATCEKLGQRLKSNFLNDNARHVAAAELLVYKDKSKKFYIKLQEISEMCKNQMMLPVSVLISLYVESPSTSHTFQEVLNCGFMFSVFII